MYIIVVYICMDEVIWETLINRGNDPGWLDQVNEIVLECETSLVDNLELPVIRKTLWKFHHKFWWNFKYTFVYKTCKSSL
jgi:hypothetical protein